MRRRNQQPDEETVEDLYTLVTTREIDAPLEGLWTRGETEEVGSGTRVVLTARFSSEEDKRKHVKEFQAIRGSEQLLERLEEQARRAA